MFVVRRPFRNLGRVLTVGTVISDPTVIKHFKSRFAEGKIIRVNEHNFDSYYDFFLKKFAVKLPKLTVEEKTEDKVEERIEEKLVATVKAPVKKVVAATVK